jgi:TRAP-type uncharacterized transport system substrate-binding protein
VSVVNTASDADALAALQSNTADLAVARADAGAGAGLTVAVLRHDAAFFVLPHDAKPDSVAALHGSTIGLVGNSPKDADLLAAVRAEYGLPDTPAAVPLAVGDVADAVRTKKVGAIFVVGATGGDTIAKTLAAVRGPGGRAPKIIAVDETGAIVKRNHILEEVDLPKGVFTGSPPLPDDDISTIGVSTRLFATSRMGDAVAAELTRVLLTDKPRVASLLPKSAVVEPVETDKLNASLPAHPGTVAYLTGNQPSLSDEAQDFLYWIGIVGSLLASTAAAVTALVGRLMPRRPESTLRILDLWVAARAAETVAELTSIETDVDALVQVVVRKQASGQGEDISPAFPLLVTQAKRAIDRRLHEIAAAAGGTGPGPAQGSPGVR